MAFLQGLTSGQQIAQGWLDTYEKSRKGKEAADLKTKREGILTAQPEYSQDYTADQREQFGYMAAARDQEGRPFYNVQTDSSGNYSVTPNFPTGQTPQVGLTGLADGLQDGGNAAEQLNFRAQQRAAQSAPQPIPLSRERVASFLGGRVEGDLTPERMETMRSRALANTIADPMERQRSLVQLDENERAARRARQLEELTGLQISGAKTTAQRESEAAAREEANRTAILRVGELLQGGGNIDIPSLYKVAGEAGADPAVLVKTAADFLNITEKSAKVTTEKLLRDIDAASVDPTKFNTLLKKSFDPDPNDNLSPELRPAAGGGFQVFYGDKPMTQVFKDTKDMPALSQMASFYRDRLSGNPLATAVQIEALNAKRAQTLESEAGTTLKRAQAANVGLEKLSPLEKNLATLKRLNIPVTDAQIKTLALGAQKDPALEAELAAITKIAGSDTANPKVLEALPGQIQAALARSQAREVDKDVISKLQKAQKDGNGQAALLELSKKPGVTATQLQYVAAQAGIPYTAPAQPAQPVGGGLTTGAQPAPYVPPAGSPAAIAAANRAKGLEINAETQRIAAANRAKGLEINAETQRIALAAQQRLADQFASDARTLSPVELSRKYDAMRGQLPVATRAQLQQIERNIR
jgi:hypothetical protein